MSTLQFDRRRWRRTVEPALAVLVLLLTLVWVAEPAVVFDRPIGVSSGWVTAVVFAPGLLALSVLAGVLERAVAFGVTLGGGNGDDDGAGSDPREDWVTTRSRVAFAVGLLSSVVFGLVAAYTLWWVAGSLYVVFLGETGGVLLAPLVALVAGSVLGSLVLVRAVLNRLVPGGLTADEPIE